MNITLTSEQAHLIQQELETGNYTDINDLLSTALNLLAQRRYSDQRAKDSSESANDQRQLLNRIQQRRQRRFAQQGNIDSTAMLREDRDR